MTVSTPLVNLQVTGDVATLTLSRPEKLNALSEVMLQQLQGRLSEIKQHPSIRVVVLTALGKAFCAGMDLQEMQARAASPAPMELWMQDARLYRDTMVELLTLPVPTIAAVQGLAVAGGLGIVLACDFVLGTPQTWFQLPEPHRGITAAVVTPLLLYRVGVANAMPLLLGTRICSISEAMRMGLCHALADSNSLEAEAQSWANSILASAPSSLAKTKHLVLETAGRDLFAQLEQGMVISAQARGTPEGAEGLRAFAEKRKPNWHPEQAE